VKQTVTTPYQDEVVIAVVTLSYGQGSLSSLNAALDSLVAVHVCDARHVHMLLKAVRAKWDAIESQVDPLRQCTYVLAMHNTGVITLPCCITTTQCFFKQQTLLLEHI
jgi:hypothetical protein